MNETPKRNLLYLPEAIHDQKDFAFNLNIFTSAEAIVSGNSFKKVYLSLSVSASQEMAPGESKDLWGSASS